MIVRINLNTKEKVCRFLGIDSIPYQGNGFSVTENKGKYFITGDSLSSVGVIHNLIEFAFMKSGCPYILKNGTPVIQAKKIEYNGKNLLELLGYENYTEKTMAFLKKRFISKHYEEQVEKALKSKNFHIKRIWEKAYRLMCITKDRRLYLKLMENV